MKTIMVVDDDRDILIVLKLLLTEHHYHVVSFDNATNLIAKIDAVKPSLLLMDVQLSGYDGRTLCKELKSLEAHKQLEIILFSANPTYKETIHESLCDDFIDKPFDAVDLIALLDKHL